MKIKILDLHGKEKGTIDFPSFFSSKIREDIVAKVLEIKKIKQPYSPSPVAGKQHSASGKIKHRRHVWKTHYGQGISRIPRKTMSKKGNRFNWTGAEISSTVGGRRAHPPKVISMINTKSVNKKEMKIAFLSALSATANNKYLLKKYSSLEKLESKAPFITLSLDKIKAKELLKGIEEIIGKDLYKVALRKKSIRAGIGKLRGRKYKVNAGLLIVVGNNEKLKTNAFEVLRVKELGVTNLAKGGLGRLTVYTEHAIKDLNKKLESKNKGEKNETINN